MQNLPGTPMMFCFLSVFLLMLANDDGFFFWVWSLLVSFAAVMGSSRKALRDDP